MIFSPLVAYDHLSPSSFCFLQLLARLLYSLLFLAFLFTIISAIFPYPENLEFFWPSSSTAIEPRFITNYLFNQPITYFSDCDVSLLNQ